MYRASREAPDIASRRTPAPLWKASLTLPKSRAAAAVAMLELIPAPSPQAVLSAEDPFGSDATIEALYEIRPDPALLTRLLKQKVAVRQLPDRDWIRASQQGLPPVRAGQFFVYGGHDRGRIPRGVIPIRIEAGMAFGTGHHETTSLCLSALDRLRRSPENVLDLGCGTGVLAIAAAKLWRASVLATDIDPDAVNVARDNVRINRARKVTLGVADGIDRAARARAPFDLILANILAGPLVKLACGVAGVLAPGGAVILSGLLRDQETKVLKPYLARGMILKRAMRKNPWSALILEGPVARRAVERQKRKR